ncbi:MAG: DUF2341 domain-containing protein [Kiritimatiellae bacterium]|nr:DUF2341 domain-containing protein [Kiritimatiellia bacterium]
MKKNCFVITSLLAAFAMNICLGATIDESKFFAHLKMTTSGYAVKSTLNDFPVLVKLSEETIKGFLYGHCSEGGKDIVFSDASGNIIPHEIEKWNTKGVSYIWVKLPELVNEETYFTMHYGVLPSDLGNIPSVNPQDVWTKYVAVFHGGDTIYDSTGNATSVSANGVSGYVSGVVGGDMDKPTDKTKGVEFTNPKKLLNSSLDFTFSGWFNSRNANIGTPEATIILASNKSMWDAPGYLALVEKGEYLSVAAQKVHQPVENNNLGALIPNQWGYLAFSAGGTLLNLYADGESIYSTTNAVQLVDSNPQKWCFGGYVNNTGDSYIGAMDEIRYYNGIASSDWIKAEYDSVKAVDTFISFGSVEYTGELKASIIADSVETMGVFSIYVVGVERPTNVSLFYGRSMDKLSKVDLGEITINSILNKKIALVEGTYVGFVRLTQNIDGEQMVKDFSFNSLNLSVWNRPQTMYKAFNVMIDYNGVPANNVPVLFRISEEKISGFRYADVKEKQFEFVTEDNILLPYEIDTWNENGESLIWVNVPNFADNKVVTVRYGGILSNAALEEEKVWSDCVSVWHLEDVNTEDQINDYDCVGTSGLTVTDGKFGSAVYFPNVGTEYMYGGATLPNSELKNGFTVEAWVKPEVYGGSQHGRAIFGKKDFISLRIVNQTSITVTTPTKTDHHLNNLSLPDAKEWWHIALSFVPKKNSGLNLYINGKQMATVSSGDIKDLDGLTDMWIGNNQWSQNFYGGIDEVRLRPIISSAEYIAAEYAAMGDEKTLSYGEVNTISWESMIYFK